MGLNPRDRTRAFTQEKFVSLVISLRVYGLLVVCNIFSLFFGMKLFSTGWCYQPVLNAPFSIGHRDRY
jgi:hypothetical protein